MTQPSLVGFGKDPVTGADLASAAVRPGVNGAMDWRVLECYNDAARALCAAENVPMIDLAKTMPKSSRYFYDEYHFTNDGSEMIAEITARAMLAFLERK